MDKLKTKIILFILFALFLKFGFEIVGSIAITPKFEFVEMDCWSELENEVDDEVTLEELGNQYVVQILNAKPLLNLAVSLSRRQFTDLYTPPPERATL
ncbi:MAG: hypothetical protein RLZZ337_1883 [Bacteroidota bacterium]|jgi:hypothetical protein